METRAIIQSLLRKHIAGTLTRAEKKELLLSIETTDLQPIWIAAIAELSNEAEPADFKVSEWEPMLQGILQSEQVIEPVVHHVNFIKAAWFRYAAIFLLVLGAAAYVWLHHDRSPRVVSSQEALPTEISPGKAGAILTLADGSSVVLDSLENGLIATQGIISVEIRNGLLLYNKSADPTPSFGTEPSYNIITTPKGREYRLLLPDGTKVWLNAASSLKYPTQFSGKERQVEMTGEAYFEVVQNAKRPFRVNVNNKVEIAVLGTSFNVNAYKDEMTIQATLLEGSVQIMKSISSPHSANEVAGKVLKPGQQAQIQDKQAETEIKIVANADINKVMAWKNGVFNFEGVGLEEAMRQLSRWYDIEVIYEKNIPDIRFFGEVSKDISLTGLMKGLERAGVHFRLEGRTLIVLP